LPNGARRLAIFHLPELSESDLRDQPMAGIQSWAGAYVQARLAQQVEGDSLAAAYKQIDQMKTRGMLNDREAVALASNASRPFIAALTSRIQTGEVNQAEAQQLTGQIEKLQRDGRLTADQAHHVHELLAQQAAEQTRRRLAAEHQPQLAVLAELRRSGAISQAEYQTEKARLLTSGQ
jgi:hypothetical protein